MFFYLKYDSLIIIGELCVCMSEVVMFNCKVWIFNK